VVLALAEVESGHKNSKQARPCHQAGALTRQEFPLVPAAPPATCAAPARRSALPPRWTASCGELNWALDFDCPAQPGLPEAHGARQSFRLSSAPMRHAALVLPMPVPPCCWLAAPLSAPLLVACSLPCCTPLLTALPGHPLSLLRPLQPRRYLHDPGSCQQWHRGCQQLRGVPGKLRPPRPLSEGAWQAHPWSWLPAKEG